MERIMKENRPPDSGVKAWERLCSLDEETQQRIAQKYYGGLRPWEKAERSIRR